MTIVVGGTSDEKLAQSDEVVAIQIYSWSKKEWLQSEPKHWKCKLWNLYVFKAWQKFSYERNNFRLQGHLFDRDATVLNPFLQQAADYN